MRIFNLNNFICINLKQKSLFQIFSISEWYNLDFEVLAELKSNLIDLPGEFTGKIWIDLEYMEVIAYEHKSLFYEYIERGGSQKKYWPLKIYIKEDYDGLGVDEIEDLKAMMPIKTPKITKDRKSFALYKYYIEKGWDIKNESIDKALIRYENISLRETIKKLKLELDLALEVEDYEKAARIRDKIRGLQP